MGHGVRSALTRIAAFGVAFLALLVGSVSAAAAPGSISGKLTKPDYTVIAVATNGKARSVGAPAGKFKLRPPAKQVTLHLRAQDGTYAGPIVIGRKKRGRVAILGVSAGARLGRIRVLAGYAKLSGWLRRKWAVASLRARARQGVPIGARRFGRVRSPRVHSSVPGDLDVDGIPNPLDIDDDGDRILDNIDRRSSVRATQAAQEFAFELNLSASLDQTANANAAGLTDAQMDALLSSRGTLGFDVVGGGASELDCGSPQSRTDPRLGGLSYCTRGGTGRATQPDTGVELGPFPECCDSDGDGFGTLTRHTLLRHGATSAQIGTGDVLIQRTATGAQYAATLQYVFATVPALVSYSDGQGNAATVAYPVPGPPPGTGIGGGPGTPSNPFPVRARADGDVIVRLTFWRPQRRPIPPESGEWTDIGGLVYEVEGGNTGRECPQDAFSRTDPNLTPAPGPSGPGEDAPGGLRDEASDGPASPANALSVTANLSACLRARRAEFSGPEPWNQGETKMFSVRATDRTAYTAQNVSFKLQ